MKLLRSFYQEEPFVRVIDGLPRNQGYVAHQLLRHHGAVSWGTEPL